MVDTVLAGLGLWGGCTALGLLEPLTGLRLFAPPMMASGIIFFAGPQPPHPKGFLSGTLCSATLSLVTLTLTLLYSHLAVTPAPTLIILFFLAFTPLSLTLDVSRCVQISTLLLALTVLTLHNTLCFRS